MTVDVAQLRAGLDAMDGTSMDALTVLIRVRDALTQMTDTARLLLQKENLAAGAADTWSSILAGFTARYQSLDADALGSDTDTAYTTPFPRWDELRVLAVDVGLASNQLDADLANVGKTPPWVKLAMVALVVVALVVVVAAVEL